MTSPFRSTRAFATRRRSRPLVERATFLITRIGRRRYAIPVEYVLRVLRPVAATGAGKPDAPVQSLADLVGEDREGAESSGARVLAMRDDASRETAVVYWQVAEVHEVFAVDIGLVRPITTDEPDAPRHAAVRGAFVRADHQVWVLDPLRVLSPA